MHAQKPPVSMTYTTPTKLQESQSTSWIPTFISSSSEKILSSPSNAAEEAFSSLVSTFTDLLKSKLNSLITEEMTSYSFCESLNNFSMTLPQLLSSLELNSSLSISVSDKENSPQIVISPTIEDCSIVEEEPRPGLTINLYPVDEDKVETIEERKDLPIEFTLYRRVLAIFKKFNRTVHDLYNAIDINRDGKITAAEVRNELFRHDQTITLEEATEVFKILDGDKDGYVTEDDMNKRMKFIVEKSSDEEIDPLSCLIISKPLDSDCIHGVLTVSLLKVSGFKPGSRSIRFKLKDVLEYLTPEISENLLTFNFKADFIIENQPLSTLPTAVEIDLINKNKAEGHANFNWTRTNSISTEFSYKFKLDIKTSTGQSKGSINLQVSWTPIFAKILSQAEISKREKLKQEALEYQSRLAAKKQMTRKLTHRLTLDLPPTQEEDYYLTEATQDAVQSYVPSGQGYTINVCKKSIEILHSPKASISKTPKANMNMDFLTVKSGQKNYGEVDRPKTPTAGRRLTQILNKVRVLTPRKVLRTDNLHFS